MRTIRELLLTEYIGAILVAAIAAQAVIVLISALVQEIMYYAYFARQNLPGISHRLTPSEVLVPAAIRFCLYLLTAYLLAKWLFLRASTVAAGDNGSEA